MISLKKSQINEKCGTDSSRWRSAVRDEKWKKPTICAYFPGVTEDVWESTDAGAGVPSLSCPLGKCDIAAGVPGLTCLQVLCRQPAGCEGISISADDPSLSYLQVWESISISAGDPSLYWLLVWEGINISACDPYLSYLQVWEGISISAGDPSLSWLQDLWWEPASLRRHYH